MRINESDFSYYDAMVTSMEANTSILINEMVIDFQNWLSSNGYIIEDGVVVPYSELKDIKAN